jgi:hypothetical protein
VPPRFPVLPHYTQIKPRARGSGAVSQYLGVPGPASAITAHSPAFPKHFLTSAFWPVMASRSPRGFRVSSGADATARLCASVAGMSRTGEPLMRFRGRRGWWALGIPVVRGRLDFDSRNRHQLPLASAEAKGYISTTTDART